MKNAAIYARYSSHSQNDCSIEQQISDIEAYAAQNGYKIVARYADHALSGTNDNRPEFLRMISEAQDKRFSVLLVWKLDRFARNRLDAATYRYALKKCGVSVVSVKESIPDDPTGILLEALLEGQAEYYSAALREAVRRGMLSNGQKAKSNGPKPYGYMRGPSGEIVADPETAPAINQLFEAYANGIRPVDICRMLTRQGFKTTRGTPWSVKQITAIIKNPRYKGLYIYDGITIEGGIPALVSGELWSRANDVMKSKAHSPRSGTGSVKYALSGLLRCSCGQLMTGCSGVGRHGGKHYYYSCAGKRTHSGCHAPNIRKEDIEGLVVSATRYSILTDEVIHTIGHEVEKNIQKEDAKQQAEKKRMIDHLAELEKQEKRGLEFVFNFGGSEAVAQRLEEIKREKAETEAAIAAMEKDAKTITAEAIEALLYSYRAGEIQDEDYARQMIGIFVESITVAEGKAVICYNFGIKKESPDNLKEEIEADFLQGFELNPFGGALTPKHEPYAVIGTRVYLLASL